MDRYQSREAAQPEPSYRDNEVGLSFQNNQSADLPPPRLTNIVYFLSESENVSDESECG